MPDGNSPTMLITGSSGEIGSHLVRHFLRKGWTVIGLDKAECVGPPSEGLVFRLCDLADGPRTAAVIDELAESVGSPDVLVNCAGRIANAPLVGLGLEGWKVHDFLLWADVIGSTLTSAFHATALVVRHMLVSRKKGVIINISSVCARGNPGQVAYSAAKAGLDGLTRALGRELGPMGLRVVGLAPGYFDTRSMRDNVSPNRLAKVASSIPLKRLGRVDEIADAVDFILANTYLNATVLSLDGGLVL